MRCSTPDCTSTAVMQWQQHATPETAIAYTANVRARLADVAEQRRLSLRLRIAQLEQVRDNPPPTLSGQDKQALAAQADRQIATHWATHDQISDPEPAATAVTIAVGACQNHAPDPEWATRLHGCDCDRTSACCCGDAA